VFAEAARANAAVFPAHYPGHGGPVIVANGDGFDVSGWSPIDPI
jgi:hypothetical protein